MSQGHSCDSEDCVICHGELDDGLLEGLRAKIQQFGIAIVGVFSDAANDAPGFSYSIGLTLIDHPEIVVFGLPPETAQELINNVHQHILEHGAIEIHQAYKEIANMPVSFIPVGTGHEEHYRCANRFFPGCQVIQMVWPDPVGKFPWDWEPDHPMRYAQPLLSDIH